jgi:hypothetical protein
LEIERIAEKHRENAAMKQPDSLGTFAYLATLRAERTVPFLRSAIGAASLIAALPACGGNLPPPSQFSAASVPTSAHRLAQNDVRGPLVYIADSLGNFVDVFNKKGRLVGKITAGVSYPDDLFVDAKHNLWVANGGAGNVLKFKRGATKAASVYLDVTDAWAPVTCPNGALYVANFSGSIAVFARRHHTPTGSLNESYGNADSAECDANGNVFVTVTLLSPPGYVVEFPSGKNKPALLPLYLPNPVDAKPDPAGNLLILDSAGGGYNTVTEYTERGSPTGKSMPTGANWNQIAITPKGNEIFGSDQSDLKGVLLSFPSGKLLQTYTDSGFRQLGGIAYDPG